MGSSTSALYPMAFATSNRPLSVVIHDPTNDQCMYCCDLRYLGDQVCTKPKSSCNGRCASWAIGTLLIASFLLSLGAASYLKYRVILVVECGEASADKLVDDAQDIDTDTSGGHGAPSHEHHSSKPDPRPPPVHSTTHAHVASPPRVEVHSARTNSGRPGSAAAAPVLADDEEDDGESPMHDEVLAAMDSIKELELLSKINDLEHELLSVEISTKIGGSPAVGGPAARSAALDTN
jgi:hypothetical protein